MNKNKLSYFFILSSLIVSTSFFTACSQKKEFVGNPNATKYTSASRQRATMRSYRVLGKHYYPSYVEVGQVMKGISSWYGPNFHGKHTSNGEVYDMYARTAAHKTWPMDTMVRVRNLQNGRSTIVRINDRGPFVKGRIIDCSYKAGKEIGLDRVGIAKVSLEVLGFAGEVESSARIAKNRNMHKPTRIVLSNFGIQVGAFRRYAGAQTTQANYTGRYSRYNPIIKHFNVDGEILYRVWLMGFGSEQEAHDFITNQHLRGAFIVRN